MARSDIFEIAVSLTKEIDKSFFFALVHLHIKVHECNSDVSGNLTEPFCRKGLQLWVSFKVQCHQITWTNCMDKLHGQLFITTGNKVAILAEVNYLGWSRYIRIEILIK